MHTAGYKSNDCYTPNISPIMKYKGGYIVILYNLYASDCITDITPDTISLIEDFVDTKFTVVEKSEFSDAIIIGLDKTDPELVITAQAEIYDLDIISFDDLIFEI